MSFGQTTIEVPSNKRMHANFVNLKTDDRQLVRIRIIHTTLTNIL